MNEELQALCDSLDAREDKRFSWFVPMTSGRSKTPALLVIRDAEFNESWVVRHEGGQIRSKWRFDCIDRDGRFAIAGGELVEEFDKRVRME